VRAVAALAIVVCVSGVAAAQAHDGRPFLVAIRLHIDQPALSEFLVKKLEIEAERVWEPYGVSIEWTDAGAEKAPESDLTVDAILTERIDDERTTTWSAVLGRTFLDQRSPRPLPIHLSFDATERMLALRPYSRASTVIAVHEQEMARALGRVLAHELGHVLLGVLGHDETGLMRPVFRPEDLAERNPRPFRLACGTAGLLGERLRALSSPARETAGLNQCLPVGSTR
jgi:hypothetical protein